MPPRSSEMDGKQRSSPLFSSFLAKEMSLAAVVQKSVVLVHVSKWSRENFLGSRVTIGLGWFVFQNATKMRSDCKGH